MLDLRDRHELSPPALFRPLETLLLHELDLARIARVERRLLFSAVHLDALLRKAALHVAQNPHTIFNYILAARQNYPVDESLTDHLRSFVALSKNAEVSESAVSDYVASALLMDSYPPGMHSSYLLVSLLSFHFFLNGSGTDPVLNTMLTWSRI